MASAVAQAYNGGLGAKPPAGCRGRAQEQSPWSGVQGAIKAPWNWSTFGLWMFNESHKLPSFLQFENTKKSDIKK